MDNRNIIFQSIGKAKALSRKVVNVAEEGIISFPPFSKDYERLDLLVHQANQAILSIRSIFPFAFFPHELIIDRSRISVLRRMFFSTGQLRSIAYEDIFNVNVSFSPLFARLEIIDRMFPQNPLVIPHLKKRDALSTRRIIQGLMIAKKEGVNLSAIETNELRVKAEVVGKTQGG